MILDLDVIDQQLLDKLQTQIPLVSRPFARIAGQIGASEAEVLQRIRRLKGADGGKRLIRQISAIFDSKSLGYHSTLVAARVAPDQLDAGAAIINQHPGVSHNYQRTHSFNLWYTLAVAPDSALGLEKTLSILHRLSGAESTRMMPTLRLFKIGVKFDLSGETDLDARGDNRGYTEDQRARAADRPLTDSDKQMIRILQQDLPIESEPFAQWASVSGIPETSLLAGAQDFLDRRLMRRFSAVLRHREAGISANAMGVWAVPPERCESFGTTAAQFAAVSHCYLRQTYPDWPYSCFTMVHAPTSAQCEEVLASISSATGISNYAALYSTKEYKKVRVRYFEPEAAAWEAQHMQLLNTRGPAAGKEVEYVKS